MVRARRLKARMRDLKVLGRFQAGHPVSVAVRECEVEREDRIAAIRSGGWGGGGTLPGSVFH